MNDLCIHVNEFLLTKTQLRHYLLGRVCNMEFKKQKWRGRPARCLRERPAPAALRSMAILAVTGHPQDSLAIAAETPAPRTRIPRRLAEPH
jgi:hypothetical protein